MKSFLLLLLLTVSVSVCGAKKYKFVVMETNLGTIKIKLYEGTPKHSENFLKLAEGHHYDSLLFHRVIKDFMLQGGASDSRRAENSKMIGVSDPGYTIEPEFNPQYFHKKGAVAAARQGDDVNPGKKSSGEQFYIVQGKTYTDEELDVMQNRKLIAAKNKLGTQLYTTKKEEHRKYLMSGQQEKANSLIGSIDTEIEKQFADYKGHIIPEEARNLYKTVGGTPFLDGDYTVFGEVVEGLDILDKIAGQKVGANDRPEENVVILSTKLKRK